MTTALSTLLAIAAFVAIALLARKAWRLWVQILEEDYHG